MRPRPLLPEEIEYRDTGCEVAPACLSCPLPVCRYDVPGGVRTMRNATRDAEILAARAAGTETIRETAKRFGVSRRTVHRVLQTARGA